MNEQLWSAVEAGYPHHAGDLAVFVDWLEELGEDVAGWRWLLRFRRHPLRTPSLHGWVFTWHGFGKNDAGRSRIPLGPLDRQLGRRGVVTHTTLRESYDWAADRFAALVGRRPAAR